MRDRHGRDWSLRLDMAGMLRLRQAGINILDPTTIGQIATDADMMLRTLWVICQPQAKEYGVAEQEFYGLLPDLSCLPELMGALEDFFRPSRLHADVVRATRGMIDGETTMLRDLQQRYGGSSVAPASPDGNG